MKRVLLILQLLLLSVAAFAQKPIYVYFNDGTFQAFLSSQVDRIAVVHADSIPGSDNYVQEVWTPDSVYRYPVASIDSIGSYMPPTKFKSGAVDLSEDLFDYVVSADTTHIFLLPNTPDNLIPRKGQKLGYPTIDDLFPYGFAGEVTSVQRGASQIVVDCAPIGLDQVFDTFYCVVTSQGSDPNKADTEAAPSKAPLREGNIVRRHFDLPTYTISYTSELLKALNEKETLALKGGVEGALTLSNTYDVTVFYVVNHDMGYNAQISFTGHHDFELKTSIFGGISYERNFPRRELGIKKPIAYGICFFANPGTFINASAIASYSGRATQHFVSTGGYEYCSTGKAMMKPYFTYTPTGTDLVMEGTLDGRLAVGGFLEAGITFIDPFIDKVAFRAEAGIELTGSAVLYTTDIEKGAHDTSAYQKLKKSPISLNVFVSTGIDASAAIWDVNYTLRRVTFPPLWTRDLVPTFTNTKLKKITNQTRALNASVEASGNCLYNIPVSFVLFDKKNDEVDSYRLTNYISEPEEYQHTFNMVGTGKFTLYPKISFMGFDLLASPSAEQEVEPAFPKIKNFIQTASDFSPHEFYNDGTWYSYKFDVAVTAEIESLDGVADWGYVYRDPNGRETHISLMLYGTSYTDTRYAYFRHEERSTACLFSYVKYLGDDDYCYDEPHEYPLVYHDFDLTIQNIKVGSVMGLPFEYTLTFDVSYDLVLHGDEGYYTHDEFYDYNNDVFSHCGVKLENPGYEIPGIEIQGYKDLWDFLDMTGRLHLERHTEERNENIKHIEETYCVDAEYLGFLLRYSGPNFKFKLVPYYYYDWISDDFVESAVICDNPISILPEPTVITGDASFHTYADKSHGLELSATFSNVPKWAECYFYLPNSYDHTAKRVDPSVGHITITNVSHNTEFHYYALITLDAAPFYVGYYTISDNSWFGRPYVRGEMKTYKTPICPKGFHTSQ